MNTTVAAAQVQSPSLDEQIVALRGEIDALDHQSYSGLNAVVVGKVKQQFGTTVFWFNQWNKNRDYSSVANASVALGKLSSLMELFACAVENNREMADLFDSINFVFTQMWESIQKASGRIVPFQAD